MNPREKFLRTIKGVNTDVPLFCPAIYNYKANFSNRSLHVFGQDERELLDAIVNEIDLLQAELITCGYDIYNVEAEALGAVVTRDKQDIFPEIEGSLLKDLYQVLSRCRNNRCAIPLPHRFQHHNASNRMSEPRTFVCSGVSFILLIKSAPNRLTTSASSSWTTNSAIRRM